MILRCKVCNKNKKDVQPMKFPTGFHNVCSVCKEEIKWTRISLMVGMGKLDGKMA